MSKEDLEPINEDNLLIYAQYAKVAYNLQNSNRTQLTYKTVTLTLIIATYVGIIYSPSSFEVSLPLNSMLVVISICIGSLLVIGGIWYLDLIVEEKKIAKAVRNGLALEEKFSFLPKTYHNVVKMNYLLGYVSKKSVFYMAWALILILTICASTSAYFFQNGYSLWWIAPILSIIIVPLLFTMTNLVTKKTDPYPILDKLYERKSIDGNKE
jgi:uncharacterized membrane protein